MPIGGSRVFRAAQRAPSSDSLSFERLLSSVLDAGSVWISSHTSCPLSPAPVAWHPRVPLWFVPRRGARHKSGPVRLPNRRKRWALWTRSLARERGDGPMAKRMGNGPVARRRLLDSRRRRSTQHAFNPTAGPVGALGNFGHWLGVSWVWAEGVVLVHVVYSISLPILLLRLAVPETVGKSLLGRRGIVSAVVVLGVDVFLLLLVVVFWQHFWMGPPLLLSSLLAIGFLTYLTRRAPTEWPRLRQGKQHGRKTAFIIGALVFLVVIVSARHAHEELETCVD